MDDDIPADNMICVWWEDLANVCDFFSQVAGPVGNYRLGIPESEQRDDLVTMTEESVERIGAAVTAWQEAAREQRNAQ